MEAATNFVQSFKQCPVRRRLREVICAGTLTAVAGTASGTGFFINQQSVRGLGAVNAGIVAAADDPSTIFFNPAGLTQLWRSESMRDKDTWASAGVQVIYPRVDISNNGSVAATPGTLFVPAAYEGSDTAAGQAAPVPNLYLAKRLPGDRWYLGFGVNLPFGLGTKYNSGWFGRYDAIEASLLTVNLSAVVAYAITENLSIGGGLDVQYAHSKLVNAIPNPFAPGGPTVATDGRAETSGSAWTPGFNIGVFYRPDTATRVGVHFRSEMKHKISGSTVVSGLGGPLEAANGSFDASANLNLPAIASAGFAREVMPGVTLLAQVEWYGWSTFNQIRIQFDNGQPDQVRATNYRDTWALAAGGEYQWSDPLVVRAGVRYDRTPTVDGYRDTTLPDTDRWWLGLGATYRISDRALLDFAFNHVLYGDGNIDVTRTFFDGYPFASTVRVLGTAVPHTNTVAFNFRYAF